MLKNYGWTPSRQRALASLAAPEHHPARVTIQHRGRYEIVCDDGHYAATLAGRLMHEAGEGALPVTGDFVAVSLRPSERAATIHAVLPRETVFARKEAGGNARQIVAANVDVAFLVMAMNADFNPRRLERYLALARESGARPLVLLTKSDLAGDGAAQIDAVRAIAHGVTVLALSAVTGDGVDAVANEILPGETAVVLGSSGAGKSTLVNALLGEARMVTQAISAHLDKGRHTTTHRELALLPSGGLILDTPGMRELGLTDASAGIDAAFADIAALAVQCRFRDCTHEREPGCAVQAAIEAGDLATARLKSMRKLAREAARFEIAEDPLARQAQRRLWAQRGKAAKARMKAKYGDD
ncbi:MAG TPA: ribosome small subunit-dependent GTPase A [Micropepsaceae bacterium]|nr:ribosome small subunit-dependent GTPase A [Micropepsaceae bacterium]